MGYQKPQVHLWSKLQVIRCYLRDMPLLKIFYKIHLIIQAEKFLEVKDVLFFVLELEQPFHLAATKEASLIKQTKNLLWMIFFHVSGIIRHTLYSYKYIQIIKFITKIFIYIYSAVKTNSSKYVGFAFRVQNQIHVAFKPGTRYWHWFCFQ